MRKLLKASEIYRKQWHMSRLGDSSSKFHFKEINWIIYFPRGNEGRRYEKYGVKFRDRTTGISQDGTAINLEEVLVKPEIRDKYPHTIGYFRVSSGIGRTFLPKYLETRIVTSVEEFYRFLRDKGI